jgi:aspartate kinase
LHVKSFVNPEAEGTVVSENMAMANNIPCYIFKENQCLLTLKTKDFSFIAENNLQEIFRIFAVNKVRINVMQNSAISFSALFDFEDRKVVQLEKDFAMAFDVKMQTGLRLVSIYNAEETIPQEITNERNVLLQQKSDNILHLILE